MDGISIEHYDSMRYRLGKGFTFAWMAWYATHMVISYVQIENEAIKMIVNILGAAGGLVWAAFMIKFWRFGKRLRNHPDIQEALNDELIVQYRHKSAFTGLLITGIVLAAMMGITSFVAVSGRFVCDLLLYVLVSSTMIAFLIYAKN